MTEQKEIIPKADIPKGDIKNNKYEEIEASNFIKFEKLGDSVEGMLVEKGQSDSYNFGLYTIITPDGDRKRFHGSTQLDDLMFEINEQDYIIITLIDFQNMPKGKMKLFSVQRKKE